MTCQCSNAHNRPTIYSAVLAGLFRAAIMADQPRLDVSASYPAKHRGPQHPQHRTCPLSPGHDDGHSTQQPLRAANHSAHILVPELVYLSCSCCNPTHPPPSSPGSVLCPLLPGAVSAVRGCLPAGSAATLVFSQTRRPRHPGRRHAKPIA